MNKHLIVSGIVVLLICVGLSGCTEQTNNEDDNTISEYDRFVGTWMYEESGGIYTFSSDGTFSFNAPGEENEGTYEVRDEKLWFTYTFPIELEGELEGFDYSFSNNDTTFIISPLGYPEYVVAFQKQ